MKVSVLTRYGGSRRVSDSALVNFAKGVSVECLRTWAWLVTQNVGRCDLQGSNSVCKLSQLRVHRIDSRASVLILKNPERVEARGWGGGADWEGGWKTEEGRKTSRSSVQRKREGADQKPQLHREEPRRRGMKSN